MATAAEHRTDAGDYATPHTAAPLVEERITWLPTNEVFASTFNPRKSFDIPALDELAANLQQYGMLQPILVRPLVKDVAWEVVAGERRWRAAQLAGLATIPCRIAQLDDLQALEIAITENLHRADLNPIEEAQGLAALRDKLNMRQTQIAEKVKKSQPSVARSLGLLELPQEVQDAIQRGDLSPSHAEILRRYKPWPGIMEHLAAYAIKERISVKDLEKPLPDLHVLLRELVEAKLVKELGYGTKFDVAVCKQCPFSAYRKGKYGSGLCLNPSHYAELEAEAERRRYAKFEAAVAKAKAASPDGGPVVIPKVAELGYGNYEKPDRHNTPAGCTDACSCRAMALDYDNKPVAICTNPKRFRSLQAAATKAANKDRHEEVKAEREQLVARLEALPGITSRELAIVVHKALAHTQVDQLRPAVARHAPHLAISTSSLTDHLPLADLAALDETALVKLALDVLLHADLQAKWEYEHATMANYRWYMTGKVPFVSARVEYCSICRKPLEPDEYFDGRRLCNAHRKELSTSEIAPQADPDDTGIREHTCVDCGDTFVMDAGVNPDLDEAGQPLCGPCYEERGGMEDDDGE